MTIKEQAKYLNDSSECIWNVVHRLTEKSEWLVFFTSSEQDQLY